MARTKKTEDDSALNRRIGARLAEHRTSRDWTLAQVAERLGVSVPHLAALESGRYSFSASLLVKIANTFSEPLTSFLGIVPPEVHLAAEWSRLFEEVSKRDRMVLMDLARKLASWSETLVAQSTGHDSTPGAFLVSLEGIDGYLLNELGERLSARLSRRWPTAHCPYDYENGLWAFIMSRFKQTDRGNREAFERTLLFAIERLHREEVLIKPTLAAGQMVLAPFFAMAPAVYQEAEGYGDRRIIDIMSAMLSQPDLTLVLRSDPVIAKTRAVPTKPGSGQFYSPYREDELERALKLYGKAIDEFRSRGLVVQELRVDGDSLTEDTVAEAEAVVVRLATRGRES